ncbi:MAG: HAD family hydrolase [Candidatus Gastranaerophilales bacterium]|nr:HAD family hydrolase [Candidatus Gastranaerophilales bacterium]
MVKDTIIFDLDGTLLDTLSGLQIGFNYALKNFGYKERTQEEIRAFVGNGIVKALERALNENVEKEKFFQILNSFKEYYQNIMFEYTKPYEGIIPLLKELKEKGYKTAVVSNKFDDAVKKLCEYYFKDLIQTAIGEGYGIRKKPEADGILKTVKELNSSIEKSIYIGDSDVDILTAENIKIPCISVLWGFRDKQFLIDHGGNIFAQTPKDIIKIIEKKLYLS